MENNNFNKKFFTLNRQPLVICSFTGITFLKDHDIYFQYICMSIIKFRILSTKEIDHYLTLNQWKDCAGSYSIQGFAESFVEMISGSYSNVIGLPMHITYKILRNNNLI
mgnify:CR=1 FL=1